MPQYVIYHCLGMANEAPCFLPTYFSVLISVLSFISVTYPTPSICNKLLAVVQTHCPFPCLSIFVLCSLCLKCLFIFLLTILAQLHLFCKDFLNSPSKVNHSFLFSQSTLDSKFLLEQNYIILWLCIWIAIYPTNLQVLCEHKLGLICLCLKSLPYS